MSALFVCALVVDVAKRRSESKASDNKDEAIIMKDFVKSFIFVFLKIYFWENKKYKKKKSEKENKTNKRNRKKKRSKKTTKKNNKERKKVFFREPLKKLFFVFAF